MSTLLPCFKSAPVVAFGVDDRVRSRLEIRARSLSDEGRPSNIVDSNMEILMDRIEVMKTKERLERKCSPRGWNNFYYYDSKYISKHKRLHEYPKTLGLICGALSLPVLMGTILLYNFWVIAHLL